MRLRGERFGFGYLEVRSWGFEEFGYLLRVIVSFFIGRGFIFFVGVGFFGYIYFLEFFILML